MNEAEDSETAYNGEAHGEGSGEAEPVRTVADGPGHPPVPPVPPVVSPTTVALAMALGPLPRAERIDAIDRWGAALERGDDEEVERLAQRSRRRLADGSIPDLLGPGRDDGDPMGNVIGIDLD